MPSSWRASCWSSSKGTQGYCCAVACVGMLASEEWAGWAERGFSLMSLGPGNSVWSKTQNILRLLPLHKVRTTT